MVNAWHVASIRRFKTSCSSSSSLPLTHYPEGEGEVQEGDGPRAAGQKEEKREAPPPQRVASPRGLGVSETLGDWGRRRGGGRCAGSSYIGGRGCSGPSPPSHGNHSRMSSTRSGAGIDWSGRGGEGTPPPLQHQGWMQVGVVTVTMMMMRLWQVFGGLY